MYECFREESIIELRGRFFRSFLASVAKYITLFLLSALLFSSFYLLFINVTILEKAGVFYNDYFLAIVCFSIVAINSVMFFIHIVVSLYCDSYFAFSETRKIDFFVVVKGIMMYFQLFVRKTVCFFLFVSPAAGLTVILVNSVQKGEYYSVVSVLMTANFALLVTGLYFYFVYKQKFMLVPYFFMSDCNLCINESFRKSAKVADGKCSKLLRMKIGHLPERLFCLLIFPAIYFLPVCKASEFLMLTEKEKPYMHKSTHTEKSIVFYFEPARGV